jgi:hypothetical protein
MASRLVWWGRMNMFMWRSVGIMTFLMEPNVILERMVKSTITCELRPSGTMVPNAESNAVFSTGKLSKDGSAVGVADFVHDFVHNRWNWHGFRRSLLGYGETDVGGMYRNGASHGIIIRMVPGRSSGHRHGRHVNAGSSTRNRMANLFSFSNGWPRKSDGSRRS